MKKVIIVFFALFIGLNVFGQRQRNRDRMGNPRVSREPSEQDIEKHKRKIEERKQEFITNFITTLEADDFQKEIIKQTINSFFDEKIAVLKIKFERHFDRQEAVKKLEKTHFKDLKELISESDMTKINEMIKGNFDEKEVKKEKKKRKKDKG